MKRLYDVASEYRALVDFLDGEEFDPDVKADTLLPVGVELSEKLKQCHYRLSELEGKKKSIEREIDRLSELHIAADKRYEWLKSYIKECMILSGEKKIDAGTVVFSMRSPAKSVNVVDESRVPDEYKRVSYSVDKKQALNDLKAGKEIDGLELKEGSPSLIIK